MRAAKCRPQRGVQRGLPLALLGNFQRYVVLRLGKFPNKLRYFLRKYPAACRPSVRLPFGGGCPCRLLTHIPPPYFFPFGRWVAGRSFPFSKALLHGAVVSVFKGSFARGGRIQGFPDKYARSEARGRFIGKRRSRPTF